MPPSKQDTVVDAQPVTGIPLYHDADANPAIKGKFLIQGFQDIWAAILFLTFFLLVFVWGCVNYSSNLQLDDQTNNNPSNVKSVTGGSLIGYLILITAISMATSIASLFIVIKVPLQSIWVANIGTIVVYLVMSIVSFVGGIVFSGVLLLFVAVAHGVWLYFARERIPFSALLMSVCGQVVTKYNAVMLVNFGLIVAFDIFLIFWSSMVYPASFRAAQNRGTGTDVAAILIGIFIFFWTTQVATNVMHVTASGLYATWYFCGLKSMPHNPTLASLKRALTTSFGSICFGSLLVAVLRFLRFLVDQALRHENQFIRCIATCILQFLENIMRLFNHYAFVYCAIYGCGYLEAARRTMSLIQKCAFTALFTQSLVNVTLNMIALAMAVIVGISFGLGINGGIGVIAFLICLAAHFLVFRCVDSGVTTIIVCLAEEPQGLARSSPELYQAIQQADHGVYVTQQV